MFKRSAALLLLLLALEASSQLVTSGSGSGSPITLATPSTTGNSIIVLVKKPTNGATTIAGGGNTWVTAVGSSECGSCGVFYSIYYASAAASTSSITISSCTSTCTWSFMEFACIGALETTGYQNSPSSALITQALTFTGAPNIIIFGGYSCSSSNMNYNPPADFLVPRWGNCDAHKRKFIFVNRLFFFVRL